MLGRLVAQDAGDFGSRNKLRLLRIVQTFDSPCVLWQAALASAVGGRVDALLGALLGSPTTPRATLGSLLDPQLSPVVACQTDLLFLAQFFLDGGEDATVNSETWPLLAFVGTASV